jgi:hypothetical protein
MFDCVIVTASDEVQAVSFKHELERRQRTGMLARDALVIAVPDPVGSSHSVDCE